MSYSQISYKDIMSISDSKQFKKVMIENYYEKNNEEDEGWLVYGYSIRRDSIDGNTSPKWEVNQMMIVLVFSLVEVSLLNSLLSLDIDEDVKSDYDEIIEDIKKNCTYYDIIEYENSEGEVNDYVCYSCSQSKYKGKIGFMIRMVMDI